MVLRRTHLAVLWLEHTVEEEMVGAHVRVKVFDVAQVYVAAPTFATIWGNRLLPWVADRYLAATGYSSQQTAEDASRNRPDNLFQPAPGDPGARGSFSGRAHSSSALLWLSVHRGEVAGATAASLVALMALAQLRR